MNLICQTIIKLAGERTATSAGKIGNLEKEIVEGINDLKKST